MNKVNIANHSIKQKRLHFSVRLGFLGLGVEGEGVTTSSKEISCLLLLVGMCAGMGNFLIAILLLYYYLDYILSFNFTHILELVKKIVVDGWCYFSVLLWSEPFPLKSLSFLFEPILCNLDPDHPTTWFS